MRRVLWLLFSIYCTTTTGARCVSRHDLTPDEVVVETGAGPVVGQRRTEVDPRQNKSVSWTSYYDLPYAQPPVGALRFHPPVPLASDWSCLRDARVSEDKICPQVNINITLSGGLVNGGLDQRSDEDCLYLNVYVPETHRAERLAVMVWIHGGGYTSGTGTSDTYGPLFYLSHDVILVAIRYRLGPLGFLSLGTEDVPGNAGVRDQIAALHWVQDNIASFGGDPDLVTVYGQSAGSFASTYHLMSPLARGLFRRAILQSGAGGFSPSYHHFNELRAVKYGSLAAGELGCLKLNMAETAECLREKSVFSLLAVDLVNQLMSHPSIDLGHMGPSQSYLPREPLYLMTDGDYATDVDILIGFDEDESIVGTQIFLPAPDLFIVARELWNIVGPYALLQKHTSEITQEDIQLSKDILNFYCGPLEELDHTDFDNFTRMATDSFFWFGVHKFLDLHLKQATGNTYFYRNKYRGEFHYLWAPGLDNEHFPWVGHSDEQYLQWDHLSGEEYQLNQRDLQMSLKMSTMWTNFVKFGDPTPPDQSLDFTWEAATQGDVRYLELDDEIKMGLDTDYVSRMAFWDSIF